MNDDFWRQHYDWMNDDQWECFEMLCDLMRGPHHIIGAVKPCNPYGIQVNERSGGLASFDFNLLTRAVVMAHDRMIRFEVAPSGPGMLRLVLHKRHTREGAMNERHPTLESHVDSIRGGRASA